MYALCGLLGCYSDSPLTRWWLIFLVKLMRNDYITLPTHPLSSPSIFFSTSDKKSKARTPTRHHIHRLLHRHIVTPTTLTHRHIRLQPHGNPKLILNRGERLRLVQYGPMRLISSPFPTGEVETSDYSGLIGSGFLFVIFSFMYAYTFLYVNILSS
ncbi:hypothetical protein HanIR_Chr08g0379341 [Helianthus annuus]|nr:hypothetical protein HanIR_Chr08g0379341 [Helianthus annuus]